jgi:hypothetical protein
MKLKKLFWVERVIFLHQKDRTGIICRSPVFSRKEMVERVKNLKYIGQWGKDDCVEFRWKYTVFGTATYGAGHFMHYDNVDPF